MSLTLPEAFDLSIRYNKGMDAPVTPNSKSTAPLAPDELELTQIADLEAFAEQAETEVGAESAEGPDSRYELILQVGAGAMGEVYLAQDMDLLRKVAYKRLLTGMRVSPEVLARFVREVQITAQLEHPNVVPVYKLEKTGAGWAYAMKLVFGKTFKELINEAKAAYESGGPVPEGLQTRALIEHFLKVCEAMDYAHARGVIHRDLKPANIMVGRYHEVYVMDWGIARLMGPRDTLEESRLIDLAGPDDEAGGFDQTRAGQILGTPRYLSPEQAAGKNAELDGRSDQLALGLILYELVSLRTAYNASSLTELLKKVLKTEKEPLRPFHPSRPIRHEIAAVIHKATARKAADRYPRVADLAADLRRALAGEAVLASPDTRPQAILRWFAQHQTLSAALAGSLLSLLALAAVASLWSQGQHGLRLQHQEQMLGQLQTRVARQTQLINNSLMGVAVQLQALSAAAGEAMAGTSISGKVYTQADFIVPGRGPQDLALSQRYAKQLSLQEPVFGGDAGPYGRLKGLRQPIRSLLMAHDSHSQGDNVSRQALEAGLPVAWAQVALADGAWLAYPGQAGYPASYDPRQHDWYRSGRQAREPRWAAPHADTQGLGLLLPVVQAIQDRKGDFRGVAVLDLSIQYLVDELMHLETEGLLESYLLDASARVMVRSSERNRMQGMRFGAFRPQQALDTPLFDQAAAVEAIRSGRSGFLRYYRNGRPVLFFYYPLSALGWYYGLEVEEERFLNQTSP